MYYYYVTLYSKDPNNGSLLLLSFTCDFNCSLYKLSFKFGHNLHDFGCKDILSRILKHLYHT